MLQRYVAKLYWEGRDEALDRLVHQTHMLLTSMRGINAGFAGWQRCDRRGENVAPVAGKPDVEQAIVDNEVSWRTGSTERTAYQPRFFIGEEARPTTRDLEGREAITRRARARAPAPSRPAARGLLPPRHGGMRPLPCRPHSPPWGPGPLSHWT